MSDPNQDKDTQTFHASNAGSPAGARRDTDLDGILVKDRYLIKNRLGRGGFAVTYLAADTQLDSKPVVVKVLLDHHLDDPWVLKKFEQELRALARLDHPGVVGALDAGQLPDGRPFLVMQFVKGLPLRQAMNPGRGMDLERTGNIVRQIGQALSAAHQEGIYHRDVKPENIMLHTLEDGEEHVKLIDFGIARIRDTRAISGDSTKISGTVAYMAPEQFQGLSSAASDVYALGVVAYEMVTGRTPLVAENPAQFVRLHLEGVRIKPKELRPGLPEEAQTAIWKALALKPEDRFPKARDFGDAFAKGLASSSQVSTETIARKHERPGSRLGWILAGALMVTLTAAWAVWRYVPREPTQATTAKSSLPTALPTPSVNPPSVPPPPTGEVTKAPKSSTEVEVAKASGPSIPASTAAVRATPKTQVNPRDGLTYVWIPPGTFSMGCSRGDNECLDDEGPRRQVTLTKGFWIGQTEVTQEAYEHVVGKDPQSRQDGHLPVIDLSWSQSQHFCDAVGLSLPTEAEWEYAARGGNSASRYGDLNEVAWYQSNSADALHKVAGKQPNGYALFDMLGNLREWTGDWYSSDYYRDGPMSDPSGPAHGQYRTQRGGAYKGLSSNLRVSRRFWAPPGGHDITYGLRCAGAAIPTSTPPLTELSRLARMRVNPADGLTYMLIPSGTFTMGCSADDTSCYKEESPPHQVTITKAFWMGEAEVTQAAYKRVMNKNPSAFSGDNLPVDSVTWNDAQEYCKAVHMRLPTEAEWEYAARAGNQSIRHGELGNVAWYNGNSDRKTHPGRLKQPNEFGLYDMLGNVFEWVSDWFNPSYYSASPVDDPQGPPDGRYRAQRGGSWNLNAFNSRASLRGYYVPANSPSGSLWGVRCAGN